MRRSILDTTQNRQTKAWMLYTALFERNNMYRTVIDFSSSELLRWRLGEDADRVIHAFDRSLREKEHQQRQLGLGTRCNIIDTRRGRQRSHEATHEALQRAQTSSESTTNFVQTCKRPVSVLYKTDGFIQANRTGRRKHVFWLGVFGEEKHEMSSIIFFNNTSKICWY
jgi:hypothetical protein